MTTADANKAAVKGSRSMNGFADQNGMKKFWSFEETRRIQGLSQK
ncbi:MAG: hypothetical protein RMJ07_06780 [Nitrososphaerota archaeon]|nr:hypothetical protein [Candidatus Bathyarchaeota archaeon]MDW8049358.1 hypothetical protein [Nitrososphaerota archaeon]